MKIENKGGLGRALTWIDVYWGAEPGDPNYDKLIGLIDAVMDYEAEHFSIPAPSVSDVIAFRKDQEAK